MLTVKISRNAVEKKSAAGKIYYTQSGVVQLLGRDGQPEEVPRKIEFMQDAPLQPGEYTIDPRSFGVGQYDKLEIRRLVLIPSGTGAKPQPAAR